MSDNVNDNDTNSEVKEGILRRASCVLISFMKNLLGSLCIVVWKWIRQINLLDGRQLLFDQCCLTVCLSVCLSVI